MKKILIKVIKWLIVVGIVSFVLVEGLIIYTGNQKHNEDVDYLIVLGAGLYGEVPSPVLKTRLNVASAYLLEHDDVFVIVSGGQGLNEHITEAEAMAKYLWNEGVEADRIIMENQATSTFENLKYSLEMVEELKDVKVGIVTNKFHMFRSMMLAKRLGLDGVGFPSEIPPSIVVKSYLREYFAFFKSFIFDR